jgi:hypothetical protein
MKSKRVGMCGNRQRIEIQDQGCAFGFSGFGKFGSGSEKPESARVSVGQAVNLSSEFSGNSGIRVPE